MVRLNTYVGIENDWKEQMLGEFPTKEALVCVFFAPHSPANDRSSVTHKDLRCEIRSVALTRS